MLVALPSVCGADERRSVEGMIVDSVVIDNREIFDTSDPEYDEFVFAWANRLHIVTRNKVIAREVLLKVGEPYSSELARETERNLRNRLSIYDAWVQPQLLDDDRLLVRVVSVDQWSLTGGVTVSQEGQDYEYEIGFDESNFLGNNQTVSVYFVDPADESSFLRGKFVDYRFYGRPFYLMTKYSGNDVDNFIQLSMGRPFYELNQSLSLTGDIAEFGGRTDIYNDDRLISESEYEGDQFRLFGAYRWGEYKRKVSVLADYTYHFRRVGDERFLGSGAHDSALAAAGRPQDSVYNELVIGLGATNLQFTVAKGIDAFASTEDVTMGQSLTAFIGRATSDQGVVNDQAGFRMAAGWEFGSNLVLFGGNTRWWFVDEAVARRAGEFFLRTYSRPLSFVTIASRADHTIDHRKTDANPLALGGETGIRGYNRFFRTGDRRLVVGLESRFRPRLELLSVLFGGVAFADVGKVWKSNDPYDLAGFYGTVGVGLRISFERTSRSQMVRFDVAWSEAEGWRFSVGTGQYFSYRDVAFGLTTR